VITVPFRSVQVALQSGGMSLYEFSACCFSDGSRADLHCLLCVAEATFQVGLLKGGRGLGLSVTGGVDSAEQWPGLIRIKRLFPDQPASQTGWLRQGDALLAANGVPLIGLTNCVSSRVRLSGEQYRNWISGCDVHTPGAHENVLRGM
jgi:hypothetical protein